MTMKKTFNAGLVVLVLVASALALWMLVSYFQDRDPADYEVFLVTPEAGSTVSSPLLISGEAHETWFYNNEFSIEVRDDRDNIIGEGVAKPQLETKTEDGFYNFMAMIEFAATPGESGTIIFTRNNPDGRYQSNLRTEIFVNF